MKIRASKEELKKSLGEAAKAANAKSPIPALAGILIKADEEGDVIFTGSSSDLSIKHTSHDIAVEEPGDAIAPLKLIDIIKNISAENITLKSEGDRMTVRGGRQHYDIPVGRGNDYPRIAFAECEGFTMDCAELCEAIGKTAPFTGVLESRPVLTGVNITSNESGLTFSATDSYRLSQVRKPAIGVSFHAIVPGKSLETIARSVRDEESVTVRVSERLFQAETEDTIYASRIIEGTYPDISRLMNFGIYGTMSVEKSVIAAAIRHAETVVDPRERIVVIDTGKHVITAESEYGSCEEEFEVIEETGAPLSVAFDPSFAKQSLAAIDADKVTFVFQGALRPFRIDGDQGCTQIILPLAKY